MKTYFLLRHGLETKSGILQVAGSWHISGVDCASRFRYRRRAGCRWQSPATAA